MIGPRRLPPEFPERHARRRPTDARRRPAAGGAAAAAAAAAERVTGAWAAPTHVRRPGRAAAAARRLPSRAFGSGHRSLGRARHRPQANGAAAVARVAGAWSVLATGAMGRWRPMERLLLHSGFGPSLWDSGRGCRSGFCLALTAHNSGLFCAQCVGLVRHRPAAGGAADKRHRWRAPVAVTVACSAAPRL